jgi:hypothetical protein
VIQERGQDGAVTFACSLLSAGVRPSLVLAFGRFTPLTGLCTTALRSQRYSNSGDTAKSLRRIVDPSHPLLSRSLRQAIRCARVTTRILLTRSPHSSTLELINVD